ncbi:hypothetical protein DYU11_08980 [Fibrisoma montanum]|uniref:Uncharacterized protein n=1 Tax=Fibrisoma montanum TaxID=2305895 RepID=A0A418MF59_9BACT|nr:hypothetical protein [Fibrisoma montanum]RIV25421.1 hypothetical protein DYU11_08980 [Fibrisoma montanum]
MRPIIYLFLGLLLTNCTKKVLVRYKQLPTEMHSSESLTQMMLVNRSPKIVLRVPETRKGVTNDQSTDSQNKKRPRELNKAANKQDDNLLYNAIEKQLFREGFSVRDRGLFNEVLDKAASVDYTKVNGLTNTDLILEWINIDREVHYNTNRCYEATRKGKEREIQLPNNFRRLGASVEFKLIYVKTNEVVGTYKLHYTPCTDGCAYIYKGGRLHPSVPRTKIGPYEAVEQDELELFMTDATKQLVRAMR